MKAIIIEEERFVELCELLRGLQAQMPLDQFVGMHLGHQITEQSVKTLADDIHRRFHREFVRWAQSHGASCVR